MFDGWVRFGGQGYLSISFPSRNKWSKDACLNAESPENQCFLAV
jgi:hypothetical protein